MKTLLIAAAVAFATTPAHANDMMVHINVNRLCASMVNIPYASDNFSDAEWKKFEKCVKYVRTFNGVE